MTEQEMQDAIINFSRIYLDVKLKNILLEGEIKKLLAENASQKAHIINMAKQDLFLRTN